MENDDSQNQPPTYNDAVGTTSDKNVTTVRIQPAPGPAESGRTYHDTTQQIPVKFYFHPDPSMDEKHQHQPRYGKMELAHKDVPLLIRGGCHRIAANVILEEGRINPTILALAMGRVEGADDEWRKEELAWGRWARNYLDKEAERRHSLVCGVIMLLLFAWVVYLASFAWSPRTILTC